MDQLVETYVTLMNFVLLNFQSFYRDVTGKWCGDQINTMSDNKIPLQAVSFPVPIQTWARAYPQNPEPYHHKVPWQ